MSDRGTAGTDPLHDWLEESRRLMERVAAGQHSTAAAELYRSFAAFSTAWAEAHRERHPDTRPFDPAAWFNAGGIAELWRWMEGPEISGGVEDARRVLDGSREWLDALAAAEEMRAVIAAGWLDAFQGFVKAMAARQRPEAATDLGWTEIEALWQAEADRAATSLYRSAPYLAAQARMISVETALRRRLRLQVETLAEAFGLPSRAEIDDVHRTLHAMRRALRAAGIRPGPAAAAAPPAPAAASSEPDST